MSRGKGGRVWKRGDEEEEEEDERISSYESLALDEWRCRSFAAPLVPRS